MRIISTSTVSIKSPRQISSSSCLRTAGVGSTGMSAATFISSGVASLASASGQSVASASVASRPAFRLSRTSPLRPASVELRSSSRVVSSASEFRVGVCSLKAFLGSGIVPSTSSADPSPLRSVACSSVASTSSPVAYLGRLLRRSNPRIGSALSSPSVCVASRVVVASGSVASGSVASRFVASRSVQLRPSSPSPRTALRSVVLRMTESARGDVSKRMSRRFAHPEVKTVRVASSAERFGLGESSVSARCVSASRLNESSVRGVPSSVGVSECSASPARAWRFH